MTNIIRLNNIEMLVVFIFMVKTSKVQNIQISIPSIEFLGIYLIKAKSNKFTFDITFLAATHSDMSYPPLVIICGTFIFTVHFYCAAQLIQLFHRFHSPSDLVMV